MAEISALGGGAVRGRGRSRGQAQRKVGTLDRWTTGTSPTASTRSRRCSSCPRPTRTRSRAYRRAAETIRAAAVPVADLVRTGRVRQLRGIGPGIEARLRELVETGEIAELAELERELAPDMVGLGRYLGLSAKRSIELARALGVRTAEEFREAAAAGRLASVPGIGPKTEARLLEALAGEHRPRPRQGLLLTARANSWAAVAAALGGEVAGDVRRWRDSCEHLAVVVRRDRPRRPHRALRAASPDRRLIESHECRAVGVTVDGLPIELSSRRRSDSGPRCCTRPARRRTWPRSARSPMHRTRRPYTRAWGSRGVHPSCASTRSRRAPEAARARRDPRATCTATPPGPTGARASRRWAGRRSTAATSTSRSAITRRRWAR